MPPSQPPPAAPIHAATSSRGHVVAGRDLFSSVVAPAHAPRRPRKRRRGGVCRCAVLGPSVHLETKNAAPPATRQASQGSLAATQAPPTWPLQSAEPRGGWEKRAAVPCPWRVVTGLAPSFLPPRRFLSPSMRAASSWNEREATRNKSARVSDRSRSCCAGAGKRATTATPPAPRGHSTDPRNKAMRRHSTTQKRRRGKTRSAGVARRPFSSILRRRRRTFCSIDRSGSNDDGEAEQGSRHVVGAPKICVDRPRAIDAARPVHPVCAFRPPLWCPGPVKMARENKVRVGGSPPPVRLAPFPTQSVTGRAVHVSSCAGGRRF